MKIYIVNLIIIVIFMPIIMGIGFGIIYTRLTYKNSLTETTCVRGEIYEIPYHCCNKICNNTLLSCDMMIILNITGKCCASNCMDDICYVLCGNCIKFNITFYFDDYRQNITYDCTNDDCFKSTLNITNNTCWYNDDILTFEKPREIEWYIYYIISLFSSLFVLLFGGINVWNILAYKYKD